MKKKRIPKKTKGKFRIIYQPSEEEKQKYKKAYPAILKKALKICNLDVCQGFLPNTSPVTNAYCHLNYNYTTVMDLENFFDSIKLTHLEKKLTKKELELVLYEGSPRQGLPTSPIVSNIAASDMDKYILDKIKKSGYNIKYTRYADDLTFSYDVLEARDKFLLVEIPKAIEKHKFIVNDKKTRTMSSKSGRRIITGVAVDSLLHPTRRAKRKLRAALHQHNINQYQGLSEWCKVKRPKSIIKKEIEELKQDFPNFIEEWAKNDLLQSL